MKLTLHHLTSNLPMRLIDLDLRPYLERYHLAVIGNCRVWLHHFVSADADRNVHDHPWPALSIIFRGGYRELVENPDGSFDIIDRNAWSFNWIPAHKRHRIIEMKPDTWSLMLVGPRHGRGWFVYNEDGTQSHESDVGRNLDWHKTAGNRAAAFAALNRKILADHAEDTTFGFPDVVRDAGDALIYALAGTGRRAGKNAAVLKMMELKNGSVLRFPDGEPIKSLADINFEPTAEETKRAAQFFSREIPPFPTWIGFDPASPDEIPGESATISPEAWESLNSIESRLVKQSENIYRVPRRMSWFEWMTRCQRELARLTNNYVGDWGPNALEAWESYPWSTPEDAATKYLNDEFKNGL